MRAAPLVASLFLLAIAGCTTPAPSAEPCDLISGAVPDATRNVDASELTATVDNPYFPLEPGTVWTYEGEEEGELHRVATEVLSATREVLDVETRVVWDRVWVGDTLFEETYDWYAQDRAGNVWYLGEDTKEYDEEGNIDSTAGSWEAGVDGARPGIIMLAHPTPSDAAYRQEEWDSEAEDVARVIKDGEHVTVPYGSFDEVVVTEDCNPFEPDVVEHKYYAPGVGMVKEEAVEGGAGGVELVDLTHDGVPGG